MNINRALFTFIKIAFSIMVVLLVIYGAVQLCRMGYDYGYRLYTEPAVAEAPGEDVLVQVKEGMSGRDIAVMLEEKGLVRDSKLFYVQFVLSDYRDAVGPGVYTLNTSMEPKELMAALAPEPEETQSTEDAGDDGDSEDTENGGSQEPSSDADGE